MIEHKIPLTQFSSGILFCDFIHFLAKKSKLFPDCTLSNTKLM